MIPETLLVEAEAALAACRARGHKIATADGAIAHSHADIAIAVTGIAGPEGGSAEKPVGLVWFGVAQRGAPARGATTRSEQLIFTGDRTTIRASL